MTPDWNHASSLVIPLLIFALVIRRALRERRVNTTRMWLYPAILGVAALLTMAHEPLPGLIAIVGFIAAAIVGAAVGYLRARHQQLTFDPKTGAISSKATPIGVLLLGGFFLLRFALEFYSHSRDVPHALGLQRATDAGLIFSFALMTAQRWEIWKRAKAIRAEKVPVETTQS